MKDNSKEKIYKEHTVFHTVKDERIRWKDIKHVDFQDDDEISCSYQEETFHSNGGDSAGFYVSITRDVIETDEEFKKRQEDLALENKWEKERRKESYLKLKAEFENE